MKRLKFLSLIALALLSVTTVFTSCSSDDDDLGTGSEVYDVLQINGKSYACYGYRCPITYSSSWNLSTHRGVLTLPCGNLSDAQKEEYDFDYLYDIKLSGDKDLTKGCDLKDYSASFTDFPECSDLPIVSGSATVVDIKRDKYVTVKFSSCKFSDGDVSYTLNGTVQLDLDED